MKNNLFYSSLKFFEKSPIEQVICLHGFLGWRSKMLPIAKGLEKKGHWVRIWGYSSREKNIQEHSEDLLAYLHQIASQNPGKSISFVTHSMGALVIRAALNHPMCPKEAKKGRALLIAPPNRGCDFASFARKTPLMPLSLGRASGRELLNSDRHQFNDLGEFPSSMKILVIAGQSRINPLIKKPNDGLIKVEETYLSTSHDHIVIEANHDAVLSRKEVVNLATQFF
ncbi:MAG: hypothetical protein K9M07_06595 [Simkaniaceae bacterium]|nr:hypothetical protein [Simkaniaceae bacterium]